MESTDLASTAEQYQSPKFRDVVQVIVRGSKPFIVHKALIEQLPFFEKCLQGGFVESQTNTVNMPEDDPEAFEDLLAYYYYAGSVVDIFRYGRYGKLSVAAQDNAWRRLEQLYLLAEKLGCEGLHNKIIDLLIDYPYLISPIDLARMHDICLIDNAWMKVGIRRFATTFKYQGFACLRNGMKGDSILDWFAEGGAVAREIMKQISLGDDLKDPSRSPRCDWHLHHHTAKCSKLP